MLPLRVLPAAEAGRRAPELVALMARSVGRVDPGRAEIVTRHTTYPGYRGVVAEDGGRLAGFSYAHPSAPGQWWHEQLRGPLGEDTVRDVVEGALSVVELHVEPADQGRGLGRALLRAVVAGAPEPRAVLTTGVGNTRARRLYASEGFTVLHDGLWARPGNPGAVVLVTPLPLAA